MDGCIFIAKISHNNLLTHKRIEKKHNFVYVGHYFDEEKWNKFLIEVIKQKKITKINENETKWTINLDVKKN